MRNIKIRNTFIIPIILIPYVFIVFTYYRTTSAPLFYSLKQVSIMFSQVYTIIIVIALLLSLIKYKSFSFLDKIKILCFIMFSVFNFFMIIVSIIHLSYYL